MTPLAFRLLFAVGVMWAASSPTSAPAQAHTNANFLLTGTNLDLSRGLYLNGWFSTESNRANNPRNPIFSNDLAAIRQAGFRYLRIGVSPENFLTNGVFTATNQFATNLWAQLSNCVSAGLPVHVVLSPRADAMDAWFLTQSGMNYYKGIVSQIAQRLANYPPAAMALELTAEPAMPAGAFATWDYIQDRLYEAARAHLPSNLLVLTAADYSTIEALTATSLANYTRYTTNDPHVAWSYHNYQPKLFTSQGAAFKDNRQGAQRLWPYFHDLPFPATNALGRPFTNYFDTNALWNFLVATTNTADYATDTNEAFNLFLDYSTGSPENYNEPWLRGRLRDAARWGRSNNVLVFCGAFSVTAGGAQPADAMRYFEYTRQTTENATNSAGWAVWAYLGEFAITDTNRVLRADLLAALNMTDTDADGLPNAWETAHGLDPNDPADATRDFDGDGQSNLAEFLAGTAPDDPRDLLRILSVQLAGSNALVSFTSVTGRLYRLERTDALTNGAWPTVLSGLAGTGTPLTVTNTNAVSRAERYYRARLLP